jgi:acidic leucine-rich nuclear phosphoprotein 32 family protein A/C/D
MEDKILASIRRQAAKDPKTLAIENFYLVKITEPIRNEIEKKAMEVTSLSLSGCKLSSLQNFPALPNLKRLNLNDNSIKDEDLVVIDHLKGLKYLSLAGNKLKSMETIERMKGNTHMKMIDIFGCPLAKTDSYRDTIFKIFPKLQLVDFMNAEGEEVSYAESDDTASEEEDEAEEGDDFIDDEEGEHKAQEGRKSLDEEKGSNSDDGDEEENIEEDEDGEEDSEDDDEATENHGLNSKRGPGVELTEKIGSDDQTVEDQQVSKELKKIHPNE